MKIEDIVTLIQAVSENGLTSFEYEEGDQKLSLKKKAGKIVAATNIVSEAALPVVVSGDEAVQKPKASSGTHPDNIVVSPLVGIFYSAPSPDQEAFVKVGDTVKKGQTLGIIEAMKLMNEIESEYDGVVEAILVSNEDVVEYGQPLFRIR